jgi:EpsI family protein
LRFREAHLGEQIVPPGAEIHAGAAHRFALVAVLALVVIGAVRGYAQIIRATDAPAAAAMLEAPEARAPWRLVPWSTSWQPSYVGASAEVAQAYSDGTSNVELFIAVYTSQDHERKLIGFNNRLEDGDLWRRVEDDVDSSAIEGVDHPMLVRHLTGREGRRSVWWTYWVDGHWTTSAAELRVRYVFGKLLHGHSVVSVLVLSAAQQDRPTPDATISALLASLPPLGPAMGSGR